MFMLSDYASRGKPNRGYPFPRASVYHGIPMANLEVTKTLLANMFPSSKFRIRYRGSRAWDLARTKRQRQQDCTKFFAETFSVYAR